MGDKLYRAAIKQLAKKGDRDLMSGEVIISQRRARQVLGTVLHVHRKDQAAVLDELCSKGYMSRINHETLRIQEKEWSIFH